MSLLKQLAMSGNAAQAPTYVDDVFSSYPYTGTGATQSIVNGIDLSTKGGLTWIKQRSGTQDHVLFDTVRGVNKYVRTNSTGTEQSALTDLVTAFNTNGFSIGADASTAGIVNASGSTYSSWSFREAAKFFDVVTYAGNGVSGRVIPHNLGQEVGCILIKALNSSATNWLVWHKGLGNAFLNLNSTAASTVDNGFIWGNGSTYTAPTSTGFTINNGVDHNASGTNYVAYVFANNSATDGLIQCGSYVDGAAPQLINLGWEPQFLMVKRVDSVGVWRVLDSARGFLSSGNNATLTAESLSSEGSSTTNSIAALGFTAGTSTGGTFIYMAIRRSNKPPTTGTQVYNAIARTGTGAVATVTGVGFAPDLTITGIRNSAGDGRNFLDRLRGSLQRLKTFATDAETSATASVTSFDADGISVGDDVTTAVVNANTYPYIYHFFKRTVGVFDVVCYTGTGAATTVTHGLGVVPELAIFKSRSNISNWYMATEFGSSTLRQGFLNATNYAPLTADYGGTSHFSSQPSSAGLPLGSHIESNGNGTTYVAYLFATKAGISKVGSYTGNGSSQNIDCGFAAGARFIMIKCTSTTGDWLVADSVRGIVSGNDPYLKLNSTAAEITTEDWVDPLASGFIINQVASSNANVNGATYIFLAFS